MQCGIVYCSTVQTRGLTLEWDFHDDIDFEGSRHQFRVGPELLPSSTP